MPNCSKQQHLRHCFTIYRILSLGLFTVKGSTACTIPGLYGQNKGTPLAGSLAPSRCQNNHEDKAWLVKGTEQWCIFSSFGYDGRIVGNCLLFCWCLVDFFSIPHLKKLYCKMKCPCYSLFSVLLFLQYRDKDLEQLLATTRHLEQKVQNCIYYCEFFFICISSIMFKTNFNSP